MNESATLRRTPLYELHREAGGRLVPFAGWELPVQFSGLLDEHRAVRNAAGLFDVSHMGELRARGAGAEAFLQSVTCNNVARLDVGRAHYTGLMNASAGFVDDLLIYRVGPEEFLLVVNAANVEKDFEHLRAHAGGFDVDLADESPDWAQIALQGPRAQEILQSLVEVDLAAVRYYAFVEAEVAGHRSIVSRTGYTGEDGFEIYCPASGGPDVWRAAMRAGEPAGLKPIGLGARDTLRLEAKMALYGNDIDDHTTPLEADLGWIVKLKKGDFLGRERLLQQKREGVERKLVGFEMLGRAIGRQGYPIRLGEATVGKVTSGSLAPTLDRRIGLGYVPLEASAVGTELQIEMRGRTEPAVVVETPFYRRESGS